jgi:hypothetical protein
MGRNRKALYMEGGLHAAIPASYVWGMASKLHDWKEDYTRQSQPSARGVPSYIGYVFEF